MNLLDPRTKAARLRAAVFACWEQHRAQGTLPTSARFVFYELVAAGTISKTRTGARRVDQDMLDALTDLRQANLIPWHDFTDETRHLTQWNTCTTLAEGLRETLSNLRLDLWHPNRAPLVLCESRSLRGVLEPLAMEYHAPLASTNGMATGYLHTTLGPFLAADQAILYLGDLDFSGGHIESHTQRVLEEIVGSSLAWQRIAVTSEQVRKFHLQTIEKYDARDKKQHAAVETEALGQTRIVTLLRARLRQLLPTKRRQAVLEREQLERARLVRKLGRM